MDILFQLYLAEGVKLNKVVISNYEVNKFYKVKIK